MSIHDRCVHCLKPLEERTADHVFPRSWYPEDTPATVRRLTAPSCSECNNRLSRIEQDLLIRLGICMDPAAAAASGIAAKALSSMGVGTGELSDKERKHRKALKTKIATEILSWDQVEGRPGMLPGFGPHKGFAPEAQVAIRVPRKSLVTLAEKLARGLEHQLAGRYVEAPYRISTFFIPSEAVETMRRTVFGSGQQEHLGPGCRILRRATVDDPKAVLYEMLIWGALTIHVMIDMEKAGQPAQETPTQA